MIGKLVLGTNKNTGIPFIVKDNPVLCIEKVVDNNGTMTSGGTNIINIPANCVSISNGALSYAYYNAGNKLRTNMPDFSNITTIYNNGCYNSFYNCSYMTSDNVDISSLTTVSDYGCYYMFYNCSNLTGNVDLSSLTTIGSYGCYYMFQNCTGLTGHVDMSSLTSLSTNYACTNMFRSSGVTSADLSSLTTVSGNYNVDYMFYNCSNLETVDLSSLISANLFQYTFCGCSNLTSVNLELLENCQNCQYLFQNCSSLQNISLPKLSRYWTPGSGSGVNINCSNMFYGCTELETVNLHSLDDVIANYMFYNCSKLKNVDLESLKFSDPNGQFLDTFYNCTSLEKNPLYKLECANDNANVFYQTFMNCSNLTDGEFTNLVCNMNVNGNNTFRETFKNCTSLTQINFPSLIRTNGNSSTTYYLFYDTFYGCTSLTDVYFPMLTILRGSIYAFGNPNSVATFPNTATVHFRKDMQSEIETLYGYSTGWGSASIVFDLIGTITVNGVEYERFGLFNENGYIAWHKKTSNFTTHGGTTYYYLPSMISRSSNYRQVRYAWTSDNGSSYIFTTSIDPQIGDYICSSWDTAPSTNINDQITAIDNVFIYTSDSAEPEVGDTAYSDVSGTALGTISAVA